jgi:predicted HicB family RNase H-like nuclease
MDAFKTTKSPFSVRVDPDLQKRLKIAAIHKDWSIEKTVDVALRSGLETLEESNEETQI